MFAVRRSKCNLLIVLSFTSIQFLNSQTHKDSLKQFNLLIKEAQLLSSPSQQLDLLFEIHYYQLALLGELNEKNCFKFNTSFAKQAIDLSVELEKYDTLKSLTLDIGYIYDLRKHFDTSFTYYNNCLNILESVERYDLTASIAYSVFYNNSALQKEIEENNKLKLIQKKKIEKLTYISFIVLFLFILFLIYFFIKTSKKNKLLALQKDQIEQSKMEIDNSIDYSKNIQEAILSNEIKLQKLHEQSFVLFMPKDKVSGDFLWGYKKNNFIYIAVSDCTGHGVPGALLSIVGHFLFEIILSTERAKTPCEILTELHTSIIKTLNQDDLNNNHNNDGMDVGIIQINSVTNNIVYSGANRTLLHISENQLKDYKGTKRPIGGTQFDYKTNFSDIEIQIKQGDLLYCFTDGYYDQIGGEKNKKIMSKNLISLIQKNSTEELSTQKEILKEFFIKYKGNHEQIDDVLLIGLKF